MSDERSHGGATFYARSFQRTGRDPPVVATIFQGGREKLHAIQYSNFCIIISLFDNLSVNLKGAVVTNLFTYILISPLNADFKTVLLFPVRLPSP